MSMSFENKVALVAGAGSGLGLATAKAFSESGASVMLADAKMLCVLLPMSWPPEGTRHLRSNAT
jgi:hypothetical protein